MPELVYDDAAQVFSVCLNDASTPGSLGRFRPGYHPLHSK